MHIDYTLHFWTLISQLAALGGFCTFLYKVYTTLRALVEMVKELLWEHRAMYAWYLTQKAKT